jgi:hypothetical protein
LYVIQLPACGICLLTKLFRRLSYHNQRPECIKVIKLSCSCLLCNNPYPSFKTLMMTWNTSKHIYQNKDTTFWQLDCIQQKITDATWNTRHEAVIIVGTILTFVIICRTIRM